MKKSTILGLIAFGATISYLYIKNKEEDSSIEGVEIKINPEKLIDGALAMTDINPMAKDGIKRVAQNAIKKYYET